MCRAWALLSFLKQRVAVTFKDQLKDALGQHLLNLLKIQERIRELEGFPTEILEITLNGEQQSDLNLEKYNYAGVYAIFAADPSRVQDIVSDLKAYRALEMREHCVPEPSRDFEDVQPKGCLYVGKSLKNVKDRLKKHLFNPENKNKTTFALKLNLWLQRSVKLKIYLVRIELKDAHDRVLVSECENALRNYFRPAIGE